MQASTNSPKRDVVDLTDESDTKTQSPPILGKRPARSDTGEPEHQPPVKEIKQALPVNPFTDCEGCIVVMAMAEEPDCNAWYKVPEATFTEDLRPLADRFEFKGTSMLDFLQGARCVEHDSDPECVAMTALFAAWTRQGYRLGEPDRYGCYFGRIQQLKNIKYLVSVDLYE